MLMAVVLLWRALGLQLAWHKGEFGTQVRWIGAQLEIDSLRRILFITIPADKIAQLKADCEKWIKGPGMIPEQDLREFAGRGSWLGGLLPQVRPFYRQVWGALAAPRPSDNATSSSRSRSCPRSTGCCRWPSSTWPA